MTQHVYALVLYKNNFGIRGRIAVHFRIRGSFILDSLKIRVAEGLKLVCIVSELGGDEVGITGQLCKKENSS